jgi:hypothetical protein
LILLKQICLKNVEHPKEKVFARLLPNAKQFQLEIRSKEVVAKGQKFAAIMKGRKVSLIGK